MKVYGRLVLLALAALPVAAMAAEGEGEQLSCIKDVAFSHEFLDRYPNAAPACREVKMQDGEKWVKFESKVTKVQKDNVTLDFLNVRGDTLATVTVKPQPNARVTIEGKKKKYSSLRPGDKLGFWMPEKRFGFYSEPGAAKVNQLTIVDKK
ncbi:MAG TPA: hypothetical protein VKB41_01635 [Steroidobacteraceae bacterium]|jgi:hypothetical protein|nr:hypothetical protein [Steroidobacteraceae bacterium]